MYKPIEQYVEGDACVNCWGDGKTFGDVPTPERIEITGSGFVGACAVCNGTFILTQTPLVPCVYDMDDGTRFAEIIFGVATTQFTMEISGGANCYLKVEGKCALSSIDAGKKVTIQIDEPRTPEWRIAFDDNFSPNRKTVYKDHGPVGDKKVLALAKRLDNTNVYVKYEPEY